MADKSNLNLYCQKKHISTPVYQHKQLRDGFSCTVDIEDTQYTSLSSHSTKKEAEKDAAGVASQAILLHHHHHHAKSFSDVLKLLDGISISESPKRQTVQQTIQQNAVQQNIVQQNAVQRNTVQQNVVQQNIVQQNAVQRNTVRQNVVQLNTIPQNTAQQNTNFTRVTTSCATSPPPVRGRVIDHVYYPPQSTATVRPPPGFEMRRPPTTVHPPQSPLIRPAIPVSVDGPNIDRPSPNKVSGTLPVNLRASQKPVSSSGPPPLVSPNPMLGGQVISDKDIKDLDLYCQVSNLPPPIYTISKEKGKHVGRVRVGGMEFGRLWGYDSFDDAKDSAAVVAIAGIAMVQLKLLTQQGGAVSTGAPLALTAVRLPVSAVNPHHSTSPHPSHPAAAQLQQVNTQPTQDLQTPSYFQQPIARGPTQSTTSQQVNPQLSSLPNSPHSSNLPPLSSLPNSPHSSNLPQLSSLPNTPQLNRLPPTVLTQPPAMTTDYKSLLNIFCQQHHYAPPVYECSSPSDTTGYISMVMVNEHTYQSSTHGTKKAADTEAARIATETLGVVSAQVVGSTPPTVSTTSTAPPSSASYISYKNLLQEKAQKEKLSHPKYSTERSESGFICTVTVYVSNGPSFQLPSSAHPVKKAAEQDAARKACEKLNMI